MSNRIKLMAVNSEANHDIKNFSKNLLKPYVEEIVRNLKGIYNREANLVFDVDEILYDANTLETVGLLINEISYNTLRFSKCKNFYISIKKEPVDNETIKTNIQIKDDGIGLPKHFDIQRPSSMGLLLINIYVNKLNGTIDLIKGEETCFEIV